MKNLKKNNKGFSLVELIVVVLIMAIIAVALAPQIMKWVKNSRITADQNAIGNVKAAVQAAVADLQAHGGKLQASGKLEYTLDGKTGTTLTPPSGVTEPAAGTKKLSEFMADAFGEEEYKLKYDDSKDFKIEVNYTGSVTVTVEGLPTSLD